MNESIRVHVRRKGGRANLYMRYRCPLTGAEEERSTGTSKPKEAAKVAAKWEAELQEGRYQRVSRMSWADFRAYYETNHLGSLAAGTAVTYSATLNRFEKHCKPQRLADIGPAMVTRFSTLERKAGRGEATIARNVRTLRAVLNWAEDQELIPKAPKLKAPKRARQSNAMRGRPITMEEFERMLAKAQAAPGGAVWDFYLRGMWWSGLRLSESLTLSWEPKADALSVDLAGRYPVFRVPAEAEKGNRDRRLPMAPEFAQMLAGVPKPRRRGRVFRVEGNRTKVGKFVSQLGDDAGVVTDPATGQTATLHDLRRAFGLRWSTKVMPPVLMKLMRHSNIATTMKHYVGLDADETTAALYEALGDTLGDTCPARADSDAGTIDATRAAQ